MEMKKYKLGEIAEINSQSLKKTDKNDEILYLDTANITRNKIENLQKFDLKNAPSRAQRKVKNNTIIFSTVRPNQNHFGIIKNPVSNLIVSSGFATIDIKNKNEINADYLYYKLTQPFIVNYLQTIAENSVSAYPSINPSDLENLTFSLPPLPTQQKIAAVLSSLDKKIALNSRINARLEQMAKRLYEHYFVQFDFPTADGKPYKTSGGKMVYSSELKREIPDGWEVKRLGELGNLKNGINYEKSEIGDKIYKIVNVRNISASTIFISESDLDELNLKSKNADNYLISKNDILIARSGTPGATRLLARKSENIIFCGFIICFSVKDAELKYYLFFCLKQLEFVTKKQSGGSILSNISQDVLKNLRVIIPSKEVLEDFNQKTLSIFNYQLSIQEESARLTSLRDRLLPLLMNGQVSV